MISRINQLLSPIERLIQQSARYIGYLCILLSVASCGILYYALTQLSDDFGAYNQMVRFTGEQSLNVLWFLLFLPIFSRVFGLGIARALMPLRKELGILMGVLALIHATIYLAPYPGDLLEPTFWWSNGMPTYLAYGFVALMLTIPLLLTSSRYMMGILGRYWKVLHRIVYLVIILTVAHVVILKSMREIEWGLIVLLVVYLIGKALEWTRVSFTPKQDPKSYPKGQKWLCVPCGYIYDPAVGDEDSGVAPGTEFADIPADWRCPVCGVTKADFVPYDENALIDTPSYDARVVSNTYLNPTTVELVVDLSILLTYTPGQFMTFVWHDDAGEFTRSYSIVEQSGSRYTFLIKLSDLGRGARIIRTLVSDATIRIRGIYGTFALRSDSNTPKVFIATGTGLAPIYSMIKSLPENTKKALFFSVSTQADLFYVEELRAIPGLILSIHITREQVPGYQSGRVDVASIDVDDTVEWYLCGNPSMIAEAREKLSAKQFTKVYSEEF